MADRPSHPGRPNGRRQDSNNTSRGSHITRYQQPILDIIGVTTQRVTEAGVTIQVIVDAHETQRPGFRDFFEESERNRRRAESADRAELTEINRRRAEHLLQFRARQRSRSRSRSPVRHTKSQVPARDRGTSERDPVAKDQGRTTEEDGKGERDALVKKQGPTKDDDGKDEQAPVLGATARELLRLFLRKYDLDLDAVEAGGESVRELVSQIERLEQRRKEREI